MSLIKMFFVLCITALCIIKSANSSDLNDEIPDFEFDDDFPNNKFTIQKPQSTNLNLDEFDDFFIDDGHDGNTELDMLSKEKILRNAILRALSTRELKYKFSEVLPLLRHLSKTQRMVFSSIISAQINGGRSFSFTEVRKLAYYLRDHSQMMYFGKFDFLIPYLFCGLSTQLGTSNISKAGYLRITSCTGGRVPD